MDLLTAFLIAGAACGIAAVAWTFIEGIPSAAKANSPVDIEGSIQLALGQYDQRVAEALEKASLADWRAKYAHVKVQRIAGPELAGFIVDTMHDHFEACQKDADEAAEWRESMEAGIAAVLAAQVDAPPDYDTDPTVQDHHLEQLEQAAGKVMDFLVERSKVEDAA